MFSVTTPPDPQDGVRSRAVLRIRNRRRARRAAAIVAALTVTAMAAPSASAAPPPGDDDQLRRATSSGPISTGATAKMADPNAKVSVIVQMKGDPVAVAQAKAGGDLSSTQQSRIQSTLRNRQNSIAGDIRARGGRIVSQMQSAYNGVHVQIARKDVDRLATLPGVESVHMVTPKTVSNTVSATPPASYLGVPQVWQSTGYTGRKVKVAVIDTGIDYTHADFGGPGTSAAYAAARASSASAPAASLVGPGAPRVKGGYDFAGDSYNSTGSGAALTPHPDANPLDCDGHGSHVAGSLGGSGVASSGKTFTGPYNSATAKKSFSVAPGIAPQVDLYALKIFGCTGTSDLTTEAIDWAVGHHMNVINLSLSGTYGRPDDPDAVAASNAVAAGTVVVSAAGNQGQNPYLSGSPGTGHGVLSVAAINNIPSVTGYRGYAPFSSSGPANGDSSLSPTISAPGALISSAAVGTGTGSVEMSGTSMAAPQVAGVAALAVQVHPGWSASQISATLGSTASPAKVSGYDPVLGGGLVDAARAVSTTTFVEGDHYRVPAGTVSTASLSFGFAESSSSVKASRFITVVNTGSRPVTYTLSSQASAASRPASLWFSTRRVTVRPHSSARVLVMLRASAATIGSSLADQFGFHQISGNVVLSTGRDAETLRVPYLMVPRAQTNATAMLHATRDKGRTVDTAAVAQSIRSGRPASLTLMNRRGAMAAQSSVFTWGLSDSRRDPTISGGSGYDLRAAGVQTMTAGGQKLVVFAVNTWDRWSTPAANEFDVAIDTDGDGSPDRIVFATDSGAIRTGDPNGAMEVFIQDTRTGRISATGFLAVAPTDSSTVELPVMAADLGLSSSAGSFSYTVAAYGGNSGEDTFGSQWARYNPWTPAITDGADITVPVNRSVTVPVTTSAAQIAAQRPRGIMVVTPDNRSGSTQAALLPIS